MNHGFSVSRFLLALGGFGAVSGEYVSIPPDAETLTVLVGDSKMLIGDVSYRLPSPVSWIS